MRQLTGWFSAIYTADWGGVFTESEMTVRESETRSETGTEACKDKDRKDMTNEESTYLQIWLSVAENLLPARFKPVKLYWLVLWSMKNRFVKHTGHYFNIHSID